jgi:hypothetical protein
VKNLSFYIGGWFCNCEETMADFCGERINFSSNNQHTMFTDLHLVFIENKVDCKILVPEHIKPDHDVLFECDTFAFITD